MKISKGKLVIFLFLALILGIFAFLWNVQRSREAEVQAYLVDVKGYSKADILAIDTHFGKAPLVNTEVIFKDEPNARYFYKKENGAIFQYNSAPVNGVNPDYSYKHLEPVQP
ncbi:DUF3139 domain-containing protein [Paenibacillus sp. JJ-223]|uniref:DUF3139 domain-containing protein n=1 Tax=Paenibacillus sp. JJ-223 TaxID=2905647 RepID=UPI001F3ED0EB|nr:DUF3139 domain-containing protein [Paenibacillus sp. JJ-223]CAH1203311.1 hypothetical protein PAECIP111890_02207 [Paenibacillus sp. JJ-223]